VGELESDSVAGWFAGAIDAGAVTKNGIEKIEGGGSSGGCVLAVMPLWSVGLELSVLTGAFSVFESAPDFPIVVGLHAGLLSTVVDDAMSDKAAFGCLPF